MFEWWQTVALSLGTLIAGGVIAVSSAYVQHRWTAAAACEAEERQATRRLQEEDREAARRLVEEEREATRRKEAEEREVRREWRRDQIKPVVEFLEAAKRYLAGQNMQRAAEAAWERNAAGIKDEVSLEDFRKYLAKDDRFAGTDFYDLVKAYHVAVAPTPEMTWQLLELFNGVTTAREPKEVGIQLAAISALERLVEDYVTKV